MNTTEKYFVMDSGIQNGKLSLENNYSSPSEITNNLKMENGKEYKLFSTVSSDIVELSNISLQNYINYKSSCILFEKTIPRSPPCFCCSAKYCS